MFLNHDIWIKIGPRRNTPEFENEGRRHSAERGQEHTSEPVVKLNIRFIINGKYCVELFLTNVILFYLKSYVLHLLLHK